MTINRRLPKQAPPIDPRIPPEIRRVLEHFKEQLDVGGGLQRGDKRHRWLRAIDLEEAGLGRFNPNLNGGAGGFEPPGGGGGQVARPTKPENLEVSGGYDWIHVRWDPNHGWPTTEVWRASESDNINDAVMVGTVGGFGHQYADMDVDYGVTYYYWVRFVGENGVPGPFTPANGASGAIVLKPSALLSQLEGRIQSTQLHTTLNTYIDGLANQYTIKIGQDGHVAGFGLAFTDPDYDDGNPNHSMALFNVDTFAITSPGSGDLQFAVEDGQVVMPAAYIVDFVAGNAVVGGLNVDKLVGNKGEFVTLNIQDASITSAKIANILQSSDYVPDVSGWIIYKSGHAEFEDIKARGDIEASSLKADTAMVDTLHILEGAVTIPASDSGTYFAETSFYAPVTMQAVVIVTFTQGTGRNGIQVRAKHNGTVIGAASPIETTTGAISARAFLTGGQTHTFRVDTASNVGDMLCTIVVLGVQR